MYTDLKGKTAVITGAGKRTGIGFAIARTLAADGANIVIADLGGKTSTENGQVRVAGSEEMEAIAAELRDTFKVMTMTACVDVTDNPSIKAMAEAVKEKFQSVDILCNNAGASFGVPCGFENYNEDAWMKTIDVNLHGVFRVSRALIPLMKKDRPTSIINTASRAGKVPPLFNGAYAVAKAGVIMLTKVMARELAGSGIRVNAICPGQIMTDIEQWRFELEANWFNQTVQDRINEMCTTIPLNRIGSTDEVAAMVAFLASDASSYITGQAMNICGGQLMEL
ncbi:MAG: SDR family NAD(P)-dependent oxidoreductase [Pseudomonadota bacterium]